MHSFSPFCLDKRKKASEKVERLQRAEQVNQPSRHRRVGASTTAKNGVKDKGERWKETYVAIQRVGRIGTRVSKKHRKQNNHKASREGRKQNSKEELHTKQTEAYQERSKKGQLEIQTVNVE